MTAFINLSLAILRDVVSPQQDINYYPGTYKPPLPSGCAVGFTSRGCRKSKEGLGYGREEARGGAPPSQSTVAPPNFSLTKSPVSKPAPVPIYGSPPQLFFDEIAGFETSTSGRIS